MNGKTPHKLLKRILSEVVPCDGCAHVHRCGLANMACQDFMDYANKGKFSSETPREPTQRMYAHVFWGRQVSESTQVWDHIDG